MDEDENIAFIMMMHMHKNKRPKLGGSIVGCELIHRLRQDGHNRPMLNYFASNPVYTE